MVLLLKKKCNIKNCTEILTKKKKQRIKINLQPNTIEEYT